MPSETPHHARRGSLDVTELLVAWSNGDDAALHTLTPLIERELHRLAAAYMPRERPGHVLQPTALVNEAYLRLIDWKQVQWQNRAHFLGVAAQVMRRALSTSRAHSGEPNAAAGPPSTCRCPMRPTHRASVPLISFRWTMR